MRYTAGVMGPSNGLSEIQRKDAYEIGRLVATHELVLLTGGLGGVMEVASAGAKDAGGFVIGISPSNDKSSLNQYLDVAVITGMGGGRNYMNILSSDMVIAIGCNRSAGTLSEIAFALQNATPLLVMRPPKAMRDFLISFQALGHAEFGESIEDVNLFIEKTLLRLRKKSLFRKI